MNRPQDRKRALTAEARCAECSGGEWWNSFETRCSPGTDLWSQFDFGVVYRDSPKQITPKKIHAPPNSWLGAPVHCQHPIVFTRRQ